MSSTPKLPPHLTLFMLPFILAFSLLAWSVELGILMAGASCLLHARHERNHHAPKERFPRLGMIGTALVGAGLISWGYRCHTVPFEELQFVAGMSFLLLWGVWSWDASQHWRVHQLSNKATWVMAAVTGILMSGIGALYLGLFISNAPWR